MHKLIGVHRRRPQQDRQRRMRRELGKRGEYRGDVDTKKGGVINPSFLLISLDSSVPVGRTLMRHPT